MGEKNKPIGKPSVEQWTLIKYTRMIYTFYFFAPNTITNLNTKYIHNKLTNNFYTNQKLVIHPF